MLAVHDMESTYRSEEVVAVPVPRVEELDTVARILGPCVAVRQWGVNREDRDGDS